MAHKEPDRPSTYAIRTATPWSSRARRRRPDVRPAVRAGAFNLQDCGNVFSNILVSYRRANRWRRDMAAWGNGPLENDDACDYTDVVADGKDLSQIERTIDKAANANGHYLEASDSAEALAAGEIIARLLGRPGDMTPRTAKIDEWIADNKLVPSAALIDK